MYRSPAEYDAIRRNARRVAGTLGRCLERFFQEACLNEKHLQVQLERTGPSTYRDGEGVTCRLAFTHPGSLVPVEGLVTVDNSGGNVYDVTVRVALHDAKRFSICVPDSTAEADEVQPAVEEVCQYLLAELERIVGERTLCQAIPSSSRMMTVHIRALLMEVVGELERGILHLPLAGQQLQPGESDKLVWLVGRILRGFLNAPEEVQEVILVHGQATPIGVDPPRA